MPRPRSRTDAQVNYAADFLRWVPPALDHDRPASMPCTRIGGVEIGISCEDGALVIRGDFSKADPHAWAMFGGDQVPVKIFMEEDEPVWESVANPPDNYVHPMQCGHEHDDAEELAPGTLVRCSMHGMTRIISS